MISGLNDDLCGINEIFAKFVKNIKKINIQLYVYGGNLNVFNDLYFSSLFLCGLTYSNLSPNINNILNKNLYKSLQIIEQPMGDVISG